MDSHTFNVYRELADQYERLGQFSMRDRFLLLAADAAFTSGDTAEAERLRQRLLQTSRHHLLRGYSSFAEAVQAEDVETYLRDLHANYPLEVAEQLLEGFRAPVPAGPGVPADLPADIPATAPLLDVHAARRYDRTEPYPLSDVPHRPLAQPRPAPIPATRATPRPVPADPVKPSPYEEAEPPPGRSVSVWFSSLLCGLAILAGVVWAGFTLVRPFLPAGWLP